jgi:hypothetical protein
MPPEQRLHLGCVLRQGAFEAEHFSAPDEALIFFVLHLLHRLQQCGATPAIDLTQYARHLK